MSDSVESRQSPVPEGYTDGVTVLGGAQWGDEGKGKLGDLLAQEADVVDRFNGGPNAGHTVINEYGKNVLHGIPEGVFNPNAISLVSRRCVVNPIAIVAEINGLRANGVSISPDNLMIDKYAGYIAPWQRERDKLNEFARGGKKIGTTGQGIGDTYADMTNRKGLRIGDLAKPDFVERFDKELAFQQRYIRLLAGEQLVGEMNIQQMVGEIYRRVVPERFRGSSDLQQMARTVLESDVFNRDKMLSDLLEAREILSPFIGNTIEVVDNCHQKGGKILGVPGQGGLISLDYVGPPYSTSSNSGVDAFTLATGIQGKDVKRALAAVKAYSTRVGEGPMTTELHDQIGRHLRTVGGERGATTGRDRRCGWFDAVATEYGAWRSGATNLAVMKLDVLDDFDTIQICTGWKVDGTVHTRVRDFDPDFVARAVPQYEPMRGWSQNTTDAESWGDLPKEAQDYVLRIQDLVGKPVDIVSVGPHRNATIFR